LAFDTVLPDGRVLQIGTVHNLGQNFSRAFEIVYEKEGGEQEYIWQTCYGISGRAVAAFLALHGDDHGIVLTPEVAPVEVVVVPIPYKGKGDGGGVKEMVQKVTSTLESAGICFKVDDRENMTPGSKFYYWELRGVPIRVEIGPRDVEANEVTIVRRDTLQKCKCGSSEIPEAISQIGDSMTRDAKEAAWEWLRNHVRSTGTLEEAKKLMTKKSGIVELNWCGDDGCGVKLEEEVEARVLGVPVDQEHEVEGECVICGRKAEKTVRIAVAY
jgi:prolyl-tRNA synthetase